jgi:hypothetical protein
MVKLFISHRGNIDGPNSKLENKPEYILKAIKVGFDVEVDVRFYKNNFYLGHDEPKYKVTKKFLKNTRIWSHAKDLYAFDKLKEIKAKYFWHQNDDYTLTSNNFFWTYPGKRNSKNCICVILKYKKIKNLNCYGVCSDYIIKFAEQFMKIKKKNEYYL